MSYIPLLPRFFDALARAPREGIDWLALGDSTTEGVGVTQDITFSRRWTALLNQKLRQAAGTPYGGRGYVPAHYALGTGPHAFTPISAPTTPTPTPPVNNTVQGLGRRSTILSVSGCKIQMHVMAETCTSFDVVHPKYTSPSSIAKTQVVIDGALRSPIIGNYGATTPGLTVHGGFTQRFTVGPGPHMVSIEHHTNIYPWVEGVMFYNGDETTGVRMWDGARSSYFSESFDADAYDLTDVKWAQSLQAIPNLQLVVYALGINDFRLDISPSQFESNVRQTIALVRSQTAHGETMPLSPDVEFVLTQIAEPTYDPPYAYAWADYTDALVAVAADTPGVVFIEGLLGPGRGTDDNLHPNDDGQAFIAATLAGQLLEGWR